LPAKQDDASPDHDRTEHPERYDLPELIVAPRATPGTIAAWGRD
jgi:hypothetical protein